MINRRQFMAGSACILYVTKFRTSANAQDLSYICGTVDRGADLDAKVQLDRYSIDAGFDRQLLDTIVREFKLTPYGTANLGHRWLRYDGLTPNTGIITLGVCFLNGSDAQKEMVRQAAATWLSGELSTKMRFQFDVPQNRAQVSINLNSDRNNSIVGRASADYASRQATMNLSDLVPHIVMHEFGHAIGLQHEHQNPSTSIHWNKPVVVADMARQGWTAEMVEANIFARFNQSYACIGSPGFNTQSIMLYPIPARWTTDGFSSGTNTTISQEDRNCIVGVYKA